MTIIVCVKFNDGLVVASDSTTSFFRTDEKFVQSYDNATSFSICTKGFRFPIGAMTCGAGNIRSASVSTLSKDLRRRFSGKDSRFASWVIDKAAYTMKDVADKAHSFCPKPPRWPGLMFGSRIGFLAIRPHDRCRKSGASLSTAENIPPRCSSKRKRILDLVGLE